MVVSGWCVVIAVAAAPCCCWLAQASELALFVPSQGSSGAHTAVLPLGRLQPQTLPTLHTRVNCVACRVPSTVSSAVDSAHNSSDTLLLCHTSRLEAVAQHSERLVEVHCSPEPCVSACCCAPTSAN